MIRRVETQVVSGPIPVGKRQMTKASDEPSPITARKQYPQVRQMIF